MSQDEVEKLRIEIGQLDSTYKIKAQALDKASAQRETEKNKSYSTWSRCSNEESGWKEGYGMIIDISAMQYGKPEFNISRKKK